MARHITLYDTTLRDGTQAENVNLSLEDKIRASRRLDELGIDFIEGGWPGANPLSEEYFRRMKNEHLRHAKLAAFGSTRHFRKKPDQDENLLALAAAATPVVTIFGKSWDIHVTEALQIGLDDNLTIIEDSLAWLRLRVETLIYDAEHFFDGYKKNREYALQTLKAAIVGGADYLILCDTNGGTLPHELAPIIEVARQLIVMSGQAVKLGIHTHNDSEAAVANSLMALSLGCDQVQGTINGYGERCGNANLTSIIPAAVCKLGLLCEAGKHLDQLYSVSRAINELANLPQNRYQPYVGESAFAHKGGIHVSAVKRNPLTYEHIEPERIGNIRRILVSDQAGRANLLYKSRQWGLDIAEDDPVLYTLVAELKERENQGYMFEGAEASFELLMRRALGILPEYFRLIEFRVMNHKYRLHKTPYTEATIRIEVGGEEAHTVAKGDGPVNALDRALRRALIGFYPALEEVALLDYKVRVLTGEYGTEARVRVLIESGDGRDTWGTVGASVDIIEASWQALADSIVYKLMRGEQQKDATV
ncbi:MAG: citramalate synthase [Desulfobulbaceae bacterium]|jgi:2-isopropylmalate synthase|nr:citramalate synthase [Desulfobulbaceae bacterium]